MEGDDDIENRPEVIDKITKILLQSYVCAGLMLAVFEWIKSFAFARPISPISIFGIGIVFLNCSLTANSNNKILKKVPLVMVVLTFWTLGRAAYHEFVPKH